jgi:hypothetical protein
MRPLPDVGGGSSRSYDCESLNGRIHRLPASSFIRLVVEGTYAKLVVRMILSTTTKRITSATSSMSTPTTKTTSTKKASGAWRNT